MYRYIYIYTCIEHKHNENKMEQNRTQLPAQRMSHKVRARKHAEKRDTKRNKSRCTSGKAETQRSWEKIIPKMHAQYAS